MDKRIAGLAAAGLATWYFCYQGLTDYVVRSSSLVKQSLFNLQINEDARRLLGDQLVINSKVNGSMNQVKGHADISFTCTGPKGSGLAKVVASREGAVWVTRSLLLKPNGLNEDIKVI